MTIERSLVEAHALLGEALKRLGPALSTIHDQMPGWPSGGSGMPGRSDATQPERLHGDLDRDDALGAGREFARLERQLRRDSDRLYQLAVRWSTRRVPLVDVESDGPGEGWCVSCFRDGGYHEPTAEGVYRDRCRWCADFSRAHGQEPPLVILRRRHEGRRITQSEVEQALGRTA